jgi:phosphate starvation-inducible PhoH-like protein
VDEDIGFIPGSIEDKLSPWLRPIFDILYEFMTVKEVHSLLEEKVFEMAPIGYLRGRNFKNTFIIADEMQNCTHNQMKMLLTRLGENSRMVITRDLEQHDRVGQTNGLADFLNKLRKKRSDSIGSVEFAQNDILREPVYQRNIGNICGLKEFS